ncbi:MAG: threonine synthase [Chthoniobacterales bacterium]|nr:threonine synthase [Chthoniobacterales bacterium]MCX7713131.1 threonine synthase [Chthoniobacterales bacterium]
MKSAEVFNLRLSKGVIERYREFLPVSLTTPVVSLQEGSTPLIPSPWLSQRVGGGSKVFLKYEGLNPTGSFKDRGMTVAISKALERGAKAVVCASTGNTSASAAAYSARAGLRCAVVLPAGKIATGKLLQAVMHGAEIVSVRGNFDEALRIVRAFAELSDFEIVNSINPNRIQGQKTASFEICDTLGDAPDIHILPVGNAGNITAYWLGYREYYEVGRSKRLPRMLGIQAEGAAPLYYRSPIPDPETVATAIRIGKPASWSGAVEAVTQSGGSFEIVSDEEILNAQKLLASKDGIFVEPASAASVAGLLKCTSSVRCPTCPLARLEPESTIVLTVTGHGLKDPSTPAANSPNILEAEPDINDVLRVLKLK